MLAWPACRASTLDCVGGAHEGVISLPHGTTSVDLKLRLQEPAWLEVQERGRSIDLDAPVSNEYLRIDVPPRYGWLFLRVSYGRVIRITRHDPGAGSTSVRVLLHCGSDPALASRIAWFSSAAGIAGQLQATVDPPTYARLIGSIENLRAAAVDPESAALALHLRAQALLMNGHVADAARAFIGVERAWTSLGQMDRADAATVARAAEAYYSGDYPTVLAMTSDRPPASRTYYAVRRHYERCLALSRLARYDEATRCYQWTIAAFAATGENPDYVNALQSFAGAEVARGNLTRAEHLVRKALARVDGPNRVLLTGRIETTLADFALRRGAIADSFAHSDRALTAFAELNDRRWQANVMLELARLHGELNAWDEAYGFLADAIVRLDARDAPARVAAAILTLAGLEHSTGRNESAILWLRAAEKSYATLRMPAEVDEARSERAAAELERGNTEAARELFRQTRATDAGGSPRWKLIDVDLALRENRFEDASRAIEADRGNPMGLQDRLRLVALKARAMVLQGKRAEAEELLWDAAQGVLKVAGSTRNHLLRELVTHQIGPVRKIAFDLTLPKTIVASKGTDCDDCARLWSWLALEGDSRNGRVAGSPGLPAGAFDAAVAEELLGSRARTGGTTPARRELLRWFATTGIAPSSHRGPSAGLRALQRNLEGGTLLLAYLDAGERGALLAITQTAAWIEPAPSAARLRGLVALVRAASTSPDDRPEGNANATTLSDALLAPFASGQVPRKLLVLGGDLLEQVPWSMMTWPGEKGTLLDTTAVATVLPEELDSNIETHGHDGELFVLAAAQAKSTDATLPYLAAASVESQLIQSALAESGESVKIVATPTPEGIMAVLRKPGSWLHVAAHGSTAPRRLGYSGIWLDSSNGDGARFLSWLDVADRGVSADLVVLDVCELADSAGSATGNQSFAAALARSGVRQVVASQWAVSDAASATWVPAFYAALIADPNHDAASALRLAQLKLRASRMFRHPFYWAGLQAFTRMNVGALEHAAMPPRSRPNLRGGRAPN